MSVRDMDAIDYIGVNILFKKVYVGIFDELNWHDETRHQDLLTRKIDRCIRYVRSGQLLTNYPKVRGYEVVIEYVSTHSMTRSAIEFWRTRERVIRLAGFDVRTRGVDIRRSLGIKVEEIAEPAPAEPDALVEPVPLRIEKIEVEVFNADPMPALQDIADVSYLPSMKARPRNRYIQPVLARLAIRRTVAH